MKARKPDGSRWFAPTAVEVMDRWLAEPQLLDWLQRTTVWGLAPSDRSPDAVLIEALIEGWLEQLAWDSLTPRERQEAFDQARNDWLNDGSGRE